MKANAGKRMEGRGKGDVSEVFMLLGVPVIFDYTTHTRAQQYTVLTDCCSLCYAASRGYTSILFLQLHLEGLVATCKLQQ